MAAGGLTSLLLLALAPAASVSFKVHSHDGSTWTEGLVCRKPSSSSSASSRPAVIESSGLLAQSFLTATGESDKETKKQLLPLDRFAEGITVKEEEGAVYMLTYQDKEVWKWNVADLSMAGPPLPLPAPADGQKGLQEGWGLTYQASTGRFIASDGTNRLHFFSSNFSGHVGSMEVSFLTAAEAGGGAAVPPGMPPYTPACSGPRGMSTAGAGASSSSSPQQQQLRLNELEYLPGTVLMNALQGQGQGGGSMPPSSSDCKCNGGSASAVAVGAGPACPSSPALAVPPQDEIWAAQYQCNLIARIQACSGKLLGWLELPNGRAGAHSASSSSSPSSASSSFLELQSRAMRRKGHAPFDSREQLQGILSASSSDSVASSSAGSSQSDLDAALAAVVGKLEDQILAADKAGRSMRQEEAPAAGNGQQQQQQEPSHSLPAPLEGSASALALQQIQQGEDMNGIALCLPPPAAAGAAQQQPSVLITGKKWTAMLELSLPELLCRC